MNSFIKKALLAGLMSLVLTGSLVSLSSAATSTPSGVPEVIHTSIEQGDTVTIHFFGREDCKFCKKEKEFLEAYLPGAVGVEMIYYDIMEDKAAKELFDRITDANDISRITPLTLVGGKMIQGYNSDVTTGVAIENGVALAKEGYDYDVIEYVENADFIASGSGCSDDPDATECEVVLSEESFVFDLPLIGVVDLETFSLFSLSAVLGVIDGFNPCAMWVLVTFLMLLMQIGDRRKMFAVAGLFIFAEAIMYYLILNVWYRTWDFVGLDAIVTPLIGFLALGGGIYFLRKYWTTKDQLICDVTDLEEQSKIERKISDLVNSPMTIPVIFGILGVAMSVNVIEFACSIGIPQAFTKILELNMLDFWTHQWYLFVYIIGYMIDDFIVFGFALYGIDKLHASQKYSRYSSLIGGILMILLGALLVFAPDLLVL